MREQNVGRRHLLKNGVKSLTAGAAVAALSGPILSDTAEAGRSCGSFTLERFMEYLQAFNRDGSGEGVGDFARFYTEDVVYENGQNHTMRGVQPILDFYHEMFEHVRQEIVLLNFAASENFVAAEVESRFEVLKDWKHHSGHFLKKGRKIVSRDFMHYSISRNGLINHVRFANFRRHNDKHPA